MLALASGSQNSAEHRDSQTRYLALCDPNPVSQPASACYVRRRGLGRRTRRRGSNGPWRDGDAGGPTRPVFRFVFEMIWGFFSHRRVSDGRSGSRYADITGLLMVGCRAGNTVCSRMQQSRSSQIELGPCTTRIHVGLSLSFLGRYLGILTRQ